MALPEALAASAGDGTMGKKPLPVGLFSSKDNITPCRVTEKCPLEAHVLGHLVLVGSAVWRGFWSF